MNILILSRNAELYSTQSLIRAAEYRGHYVRVVDHLQCDLVVEQSKPQIYYYGEELVGYDAIIPRIGNSATAYGAAVIRQFELQGIYTTVRSGSLLKARDKLSCMQYLAKEGIGVPKTMAINNHNTIEFMLDKIPNYPKIIKLVSGTHGLGVILSENSKNAEAILETFQKMKRASLVQEFIEESNGADVRVIVIGGKIIAAMVRQAKEGDFRSNLHRGGSSYAVKPSQDEGFAAVKASNLLGLEVAGVDMLRSDRGPLILEVNASPGFEGIEGTTGIDVAGQVILLIEEKAGNSFT